VETNEIVSRLTPIFHDVFNNDALVVSEGMTAADVPTWDSLSNINMIIAVEKAVAALLGLVLVVGLWLVTSQEIKIVEALAALSGE
jgi:hypothetical protein